MAKRFLEKFFGLLLFFGMLGTAMSFDASKYKESSSLSNTFKIHWTIDNDKIFLAIQADTRGWLGFGIGEPTSGSMPGSDMITGTVSNDGKPHIQDRFATDFATPEVDRCEDWTLVAGEMTDEGWTIIEVSRPLDTKDPQDRVIMPGPNRIVWAWGDNDEISYHDTNRGALSFTFFGEKQEPQIDGFTRNYVFDHIPVPTKTTTYTAMAFALPVDRDYHLVKVEASISIPLIHHAVLYGCTENSDWVQSHLNESSEVYTGDDHIPSYCRSVLWAWTPGMGPLVLPEHAGFKVSPSAGGYKFLVVQTHYHNPDEVLTVDNSIYTLTFTTQLRAHEAGVIELGDPLISMSRPIPAKSEGAHYEFSCSPSCTSQWEHDITVWGSFLHMHKIGHRMYSAQYRGTTSLGIINSVEFYERDFQHVIPVDNRLIQKGDRINTHCVYRTLNRNDTQFGLSSDQEMCVDFLYYYPKLNARYCGYVERNEVSYSLCGSSTNVVDERNPTVSDGLMELSFGVEGSCHVEVVMKVSKGAMFGVCLLSTVIIVGMTAGLLWIALRTKDPRLDNNHQQLEEEHH